MTNLLKKKVPKIKIKNKESVTVKSVLLASSDITHQTFDEIREIFQDIKDVSHKLQTQTVKLMTFAAQMDNQILNFLNENANDVASGSSYGPFYPINFSQLNLKMKQRKGRPPGTKSQTTKSDKQN